VWYNQLCKAHPRKEVVDPVTGKTGYVGTNSFGGGYVTDEPYENCRDFNDGFCGDFVPVIMEEVQRLLDS
jgi:hypothetical protein